VSKIAISFMCKDLVEQSARSLPPLTETRGIDVFIIDGSKTQEGHDCYKALLKTGNVTEVHQHIGGGPDAAAAYAFTMMLNHPNKYDFVGLYEQDVLLESDWLNRTMELFEIGRRDGLEVGMVSARCYEDRILCQRDGYALAHNTGYGMTIYTREAARIWLRNKRTGWTTENRRLFAQLVDRDIGAWWAFRYGEHHLGSDWSADRVIAAHGLASLALTPTACTDMLDNDLAYQQLTLARHPVEALRDDIGFAKFVERTRMIRSGEWSPGHPGARQHAPDGHEVIFPHHCGGLGAAYSGRWRLKASIGWGPFLWEAAEPGATVVLSLLGSCQIMVTRPDASAGMVEIEAPGDGYGRAGVFWQNTLAATPTCDIQAIELKGDCQFRPVRFTALTEGVRFCGVRCRDRQPVVETYSFDHSILPPVQ
jgi:hypothetical protein